MANPRKPNKLHKKQGTYRAYRHGYGDNPEPEVVKEYINPPDTFNRWAKQEWKRVVPQLIENELLSTIDIGILQIAIEQYGIYRECIDNIYYKTVVDENGKQKRVKQTLSEYFEGKTSYRAPEVPLMKSAFAHYKEVMFSFGVTPVARSRVEVKPKKDQDPMEQLLQS